MAKTVRATGKGKLDGKWSDLFSRLADAQEGTPRFSIRGCPKHLFYDYDGYSGGHEIVDKIIALLESHGIDPCTTGSDSPLNVSSYETDYDFEDDGLHIYPGNAFVEDNARTYWLSERLAEAQPTVRKPNKG
jgi:hypothetical protein